MPFKFAKGQFESGLATKVLTDVAVDPFPYLDEAANKKMMAMQWGLLREFTDLAFHQSTAMRWEEPKLSVADSMDVDAGINTVRDLFADSENPF